MQSSGSGSSARSIEEPRVELLAEATMNLDGTYASPFLKLHGRPRPVRSIMSLDGGQDPSVSLHAAWSHHPLANWINSAAFWRNFELKGISFQHRRMWVRPNLCTSKKLFWNRSMLVEAGLCECRPIPVVQRYFEKERNISCDSRPIRVCQRGCFERKYFKDGTYVKRLLQ